MPSEYHTFYTHKVKSHFNAASFDSYHLVFTNVHQDIDYIHDINFVIELMLEAQQ